MPINSLQSIFGTSAVYTPASQSITIDLNDMKDDANGGEILNGLGLDDPTTITALNIDDYAVNIFYGLILIASQNQSPGIFDDATEKMYLTEGGLRIGNGNRAGQIQRIFNVNLFDSNANLDNSIDIDDV